MSTDTPVSDLVVNKLTYDQYKEVIDGNTYDNTEVYEIKDISDVFTTQNNCISNCIVEIPQNIKVELSNNVLTLKSGSILTKAGSTYATVTTTTDITRTLTRTINGRYTLFYQGGGLHSERLLSEITSGNTAGIPTTYDAYTIYYNTDNKEIYHPSTSSMEIWDGCCYPIVLLDYNNGVWSIAKDYNGNDMIFNGFGFIGSNAYALPGIECMFADEKSDNGKLKSILFTTSSLSISNAYNSIYMLHYHTTYTSITPAYFTNYVEQEEQPSFANGDWYQPSTNKMTKIVNSVLSKEVALKAFKATVSDGKITSLTPYLPVRLMTGVTYRQW